MDNNMLNKWVHICLTAENVASEVLDCDEARKELSRVDMETILDLTGDSEWVYVDCDKNIRLNSQDAIKRQDTVMLE